MIKSLKLHEQAALFAKLSSIAYMHPEKKSDKGELLQDKALELGFKATFISNKGAEAYIFEDKENIVIACRGTEPKQIKDIKADLQIKRVPADTGIGKVHRGFKLYTDKIWDKLVDAIKNSKRENKELWITGHSLGGAMATVMAKRCAETDELKTPTMVFTYGSPRVGNGDYVNSIDQALVHHRFMNDGDIVTKIPTAPFYFHCGALHHISKNGEVSTYHKINWFDTIVDSLKHPIKSLIGDAKDHSSDNYVALLESWAKKENTKTT